MADYSVLYASLYQNYHDKIKTFMVYDGEKDHLRRSPPKQVVMTPQFLVFVGTYRQGRFRWADQVL